MIKKIISKLLRIFSIDLTNIYHFKSILGSKFYLSTEVEAHSLWQYPNANHSDEFDYILQILNPSHFFLDIGANIGRFTIPIASQISEDGIVVAVEPTASAFKALSNNVKLNQYKHVHIKNVGISDKTEKKIIYNYKGFSNLNSMYERNEGKAYDKEECTFVNGTEFLNQFYRFPNIIKIDVEGAELVVLKSMETHIHHVEVIVFEYSKDNLANANTSGASVIDFFQKNKFDIFELGKFKRVLTSIPEELKHCNLVAINTSSSLHPNKKK